MPQFDCVLTLINSQQSSLATMFITFVFCSILNPIVCHYYPIVNLCCHQVLFQICCHCQSFKELAWVASCKHLTWKAPMDSHQWKEAPSLQHIVVVAIKLITFKLFPNPVVIFKIVANRNDTIVAFKLAA